MSAIKISTGTFGDSTLLENSLSQNSLLYPMISKVIIRQYPQYALTFMTDGLGRYASEKVIGSNSFEWWIKGRLTRPMTATGTTSGTGASKAPFTAEFVENFANSNDILKFKDGQQALVITEPVVSAGGYTYTMILQDADSTSTLTASNVAAGARAGIIGNAHTEMSEKGYGSLAFPSKYRNYLSTCRQAGEISGDAATAVTWVEAQGERVWYFQAEADIREKFMYEMEVQKWYNKLNVDSSGNALVYQAGKPVITGDGLFAQIDSGNIGTYSAGLTEKQITNFLADLRYTNGAVDAEYTVFAGTGAMREFQQAMKDYYIASGQALAYDAGAGAEVELGSNFMTYHAMGLKMTLVHTPIFDDPNLHHDLAPDGLPKESYKMAFINTSTLPEGVSNLESIVKGEGGHNRAFVHKYIPGMIDPFDPKSIKASTAKDSFGVEYLSQSGIILRNPKSCGILEYV
jgi:hypothetical protein